MSHRINIIVHDDVWRFLKEVPQGERSRTVNLALREWARRRRRVDAVVEMDRLRRESETEPFTSTEIVRWIREDRDSGH